jgi:hypothetical protein
MEVELRTSALIRELHASTAVSLGKELLVEGKWVSLDTVARRRILALARNLTLVVYIIA